MMNANDKRPPATRRHDVLGTPNLPLVLFIFGAAALSGAPALADPAARKAQLVVRAPDNRTYPFGTIRAFVRRMKTFSQTCGASPYEHGIDIDCRAPDMPPMVYLHFEYEPDRETGVAYLESLRIQGRNGGEAPRHQWLAFMKSFTRQSPKPADF